MRFYLAHSPNEMSLFTIQNILFDHFSVNEISLVRNIEDADYILVVVKEDSTLSDEVIADNISSDRPWLKALPVVFATTSYRSSRPKPRVYKSLGDVKDDGQSEVPRM